MIGAVTAIQTSAMYLAIPWPKKVWTLPSLMFPISLAIKCIFVAGDADGSITIYQLPNVSDRIRFYPV